VSDLYGEEYYRRHCGPIPLERSAIWLGRASAICDHIIRSLKPRRVMDAGCAIGLLVETLWDNGVEAFGIDISSYAISRVRPDLQKYCRVASIIDPFVDPITGGPIGESGGSEKFDLVICIEVLEHLQEQDALKAIENLTRIADTILFSSDPYDFVEPTHVNVRPLLYWMHAFAALQFYPDLTYDAGFVAPHAMLFRRSAAVKSDDVKWDNEDVLQAHTELVRHKIIVSNMNQHTAGLTKQVEDLTADRNTLQKKLKQKIGPRELQSLQDELRQMAANLRVLMEYRTEQEAESALLKEKVAQQEAQISTLKQQLGEADLNGHGERRLAEFTTALDRVHSNLYKIQHADNGRQTGALQRTLKAGKRLLANPAEKPGEEDEVVERFRVSFDDPADGATISRQPQILVHGWAIAESGVWTIEVLLDGTYRVPAEYGRRRPDVSSIFPDYTDAGTSGFIATLSTSSLADGPHFLLVNIHTNRGNVLSGRQEFTLISQTPYEIWLSQNTPSPATLQKMREEARTMVYKPLISIVTPLYRTPLKYLDACIQSVFDQLYENWQLCLVDDGSGDPALVRRAEEFARRDPRVIFRAVPNNCGISIATNECLALATGDFVAFLDHDDTLSPTALFEVVKQLNFEPQLDVLYSDEDKITTDGHHFNYFFKPDWSPELFLSTNYICHFLVVRRKLIEQVGGLRAGFEGSQDYDLMLRVIEHTSRVRRISKILYHWRSHPQSTASSHEQKPAATLAAQKALTEHIERIGENAEVIELVPGRYRIKYRLSGNPEIRIVIPTGGSALLKDAISSVLEKSTYTNYSIVVVDNSPDGSVPRLLAEILPQSDRITVLNRVGQPFNFSALCNFGAQGFQGEYLLFLNDDTTVITPDWLEALMEHAQHTAVGAVGGLLLFPDLKIQHAGVLLGIYGVGGHAFRLLDSREHHYFMFPEVTRNCSAVTGACLMVRRQAFEEISGFDEKNLPTCFQDVDFCLRLIEKGYRIVYTPFASLMHYESATKTSIAEGYEVDYMHKRWSHSIADDPYYNPNLSRRREDYSLNFEGPKGQ